MNPQELQFSVSNRFEQYSGGPSHFVSDGAHSKGVSGASVSSLVRTNTK
jgi:hypothetical protein